MIDKKELIKKISKLREKAHENADKHFNVPYEELFADSEYEGMVFGWNDAISEVLKILKKL